MSMVRVPGTAIERHRRRASATSLPASRIRAISRADFSSGRLENSDLSTASLASGLQECHDRIIHLLDLADPVDFVQNPPAIVVGGDRGGVAVKLLQPPPHRLDAVVVAAAAAEPAN